MTFFIAKKQQQKFTFFIDDFVRACIPCPLIPLITIFTKRNKEKKIIVHGKAQ